MWPAPVTQWTKLAPRAGKRGDHTVGGDSLNSSFIGGIDAPIRTHLDIFRIHIRFCHHGVNYRRETIVRSPAPIAQVEDAPQRIVSVVDTERPASQALRLSIPGPDRDTTRPWKGQLPSRTAARDRPSTRIAKAVVETVPGLVES